MWGSTDIDHLVQERRAAGKNGLTENRYMKCHGHYAHPAEVSRLSGAGNPVKTGGTGGYGPRRGLTGFEKEGGERPCGFTGLPVPFKLSFHLCLCASVPLSV